MGQSDEVTVQLRNVDNRRIIEVKGKHIALSKVKSRIEKYFPNEGVEEVRIFAGINLNIDADLSCDIWHGKNLIVLAEKIIVGVKATWNVSGKDSNHVYSSDAGTSPDGLGNDGEDGYPGESGGNVLVQAKTIENPERLTIISVGGNGSKGQDGGNGKDGKDGTGISKAELMEKFPPCASALIERRYHNAKTIMENTLLPASLVRTQWLATSPSKGYIYTSDVLGVMKATWYQYFDAYLDVLRPDGSEVIYSTYHHWFKSQSFLLYKGTPGEQGKHGGRYGTGGQGGYPGEITVKSSVDGRKFNITTIDKWGDDGSDGTGGLQGWKGKDGWDMGWTAHIHFETEIYGKDANSKLELSFHSSVEWNRYWCPYKALRSNFGYVSIDRVKNSSSSISRHRNITKARRERQHHANAMRKKSILSWGFFATFSEYLQEIEKEKQELEKRQIEMEMQRIQREKQELEKKQIEKEKQELEKRQMELVKQELENQRIKKEKQAIEKEKQELEKRRIEQEKQKQERQKIEKEYQEREKQRIEIEKQELEKRRIELGKQGLEKKEIEKEKQRIEKEKQELEKRQIEFQKQEIENQRIEKEKQEIEKQRIEKEKQELEKRQIELEKQEIENQRIEKEKQLIEQEKQALEKQRIVFEKKELEKQLAEKEKQRNKKEKQELEKRRIETEKQRFIKERQESDKQRVEREKQELEKQRIENEKNRLEKLIFEQSEIAEMKQRLTKQHTEYVQYDVLQQVVKKQVLYQTTEQEIKRYINFAQDSSDLNTYNYVQLDTSMHNTCETQLFDILKTSLNLDDWLQLQTHIVDRNELTALVKLFESLKPEFNTVMNENSNAKIEVITETLKMKDRFTVLRNAVLEYPTYHTSDKSFVLTAHHITRYLEETNEAKDTFNHPALGLLNQYLFENSSTQRGSISQFVTTGLKSSDNALKRAIEAFFLEMNSSNVQNERVQRFYVEYYDYLEKQQNNIDTLSALLEDALQKQQHKEALRLWNESADDDELLDDLEKALKQDEVLSSLYGRLMHEKNSEYDWENCAADEQIQELFKINIEQKGIICESYRVLLAFVYNVNIRVYTKNMDNEIVLCEDHNPESGIAIHILLKINEFIPLAINEAYRQLEEERLHRDNIYRQILTERENEYQELDEKKAMLKIAAFFSDGEEALITERLQTISSQYTGQHRVFESILQRFSFEGRHVSSNELCFLINSILEHCIGKRQERFTFTWIISAYNQCNWTDELVLLLLENGFKRQVKEKAEWREYMSHIFNKGVLLAFAAQFARNPCSEECVRKIFYLLSNVPIQSVNMDHLELTEWSYVLKEHYWKRKLNSLMTWNNESESLTFCSFFILSIENMYGDTLTEMLFESLTSKGDKLPQETVMSILSSFHTQKWNLCEDDLDLLKQYTLQEWIEYMKNQYKIILQELNVFQLVTIIKSNANTSSNIINHMPQIQYSVSVISRNEREFKNKSISSFTINDIEQWANEFRDNKKEPNVDVYEEMLAVIDRATLLTKGFRLRDTQRLTVLSLLTNDKSTLAQVATGEGKTLIVVAIAVIRALFGEKVDIVTSSSVLAQRDSDENDDIFELFGLRASHNCSENMEERKYAYSSNQIIYGDLSNFQRDYLLDRFYGKNVLGDRSFELVIVDEVDSMLLDKGNNILYLAHDIAGMDKLESVYVYIWQMVNSLFNLPEDELVKTIKQSVLNDMYPRIQKEDIQSLDSNLNKSNVLILWHRLVESGVICDSGRLLTNGIDSNKLDEVLSSDFTQYKDRLKFLLGSRLDYEANVKVPNFLKLFVERHLDGWISSALAALHMVPGQYYVIGGENSETNADPNANVIIIDRDTGTDLVSSQWDEALHQFVQLKHGCKLSTQTLKAVFISNVTFFKNYKLLYGLTGTLGSKRERELLQNIHKVDFVTVPTHKPKQFDEYESIICSGTEDWKQCVRREVEKLTKIDQRSVLIICETISNVEALQKEFQAENPTNVRTYTRDYEKLIIPKDGLQQGQIIIATNLAGRGTDIKISKKLEEAGGLHVLLTYLPSNIRIEEQAFGRSARKGEKGSGGMIIMVTEGTTNNPSNIITLKQKRNDDEIFRIAEKKSYYETTIKTEEYCFNKFNKLYEKQMKTLAHAGTPDSVKEILLQSSLDKWSFWLDKNNELISNASDGPTKQQVKLLLDQFLAHFNVLIHAIEQLLKNDQESVTLPIAKWALTQYTEWQATMVSIWSTWVEGSPMQTIKFGKYLSQPESKYYDRAFELFGKVIENEPYYCEAAYYYRAYARSLDTTNKGEFENDLRKAERLFDRHIKTIMHASGVVDDLKTSTSHVEGYEVQKKSLLNLYSLFIRTIDDMLGHAITPESFMNDRVMKDSAERIFEDLVQNDMIKKAEIINNITDAQLKNLHLDYGLSVNKLKEFFAQHTGTIDEKDFLEAIRKSFAFPSRIEFWEILVNQNVLHSVTKYVSVNEERLLMMDPALMKTIKEKLEKGELVKEVIQLDKDQVLLIHEQQSKSYFEKNKLMSVIGEKKYTSIEEKGILSFNERASVDKSLLADCVFSKFDSIVAEDICNKTQITASEADIIINKLLEQKVLEKRGSDIILTTNNTISQDKLLPAYPVYENVIRSILSACFAYTLALRNISRQLEEEHSSEIRLELQPDPHRMFFNDLLEQKIIQPPQALHEIDEIENMYGDNWTTKQVTSVLTKDIGLNEKYTKLLVNVLLKNEWIIRVKKSYILRQKDVRSSLDELKSGIESINEKHGLVDTYDIAVAVEKWFDMQLILEDSETAKHIENVLKTLKPVVPSLKNPKGDFKSIMEFYGSGQFGNADEIRIFITNGLEHLLDLADKTWTAKMLFNTVPVVCNGFAEIAVGAIMEVFTAGAMTEAGAEAIIGEGISDVMFAVTAGISGDFGWKDYGQQKLESLAFTAITGGADMFFSQGAKLSRMGHKVAVPALEIAVGSRAIVKETAKRVAVKMAQGVSFALANAVADKIVTDHLEAMLDTLAWQILSGVKGEVAKHNVTHTLHKAYNLLGEHDAKDVVTDLTIVYLGKQNMTETFLPTAESMMESMMNGIQNAKQKADESSSVMTLISELDGVLELEDIVTHITKFIIATQDLLDNINNEMVQKLANAVQRPASSEEKQTNGGYFEQFMKEVVEQWEKTLSKRVGKLIGQHVVLPVLKMSINETVSYVGQKLGDIRRSMIKSKASKDLQRVKTKHEQTKIQQPNMTNDTKRQLTEQYNGQLLNNFKKTRSPALLVKTIRENVPMDLICVGTFALIVHKMLQAHNPALTGLTIIVHGNKGLKQSFSSGIGGPQVHLNLLDNHFALLQMDGAAVDTFGNNSLYGALATAIPDLQSVGEEAFQATLSEFIENNKSIHRHILQDWKRVPLNHGTVDGTVHLNPTINTADEDREHFSEHYRPPVHHLEARFKHMFVFAGELKKASNESGLRVDQIIKSADPRKDSKTTILGEGRRRVHVVRVSVLEELKNLKPYLHKRITKHALQKQLTDTNVNQFKKIGDVVDKKQADWAMELAKIDYIEGLTPNSRKIIEKIRYDFIKLYDDNIENLKATRSPEEDIVELEIARDAIQNTYIENLYEFGKKGYNHHYNPIPRPSSPQNQRKKTRINLIPTKEPIGSQIV